MTDDEEEYCEECGEYLDDCECDGGPTLNEILDGTKKVLDIAKSYKELTTPKIPPDIKSENRHKETIKWTKIGIAVGVIIGIIAIASSMF